MRLVNLIVAEEGAEASGEETRRFERGFTAKVALDSVHPTSQSVALVPQGRGVLEEVVDPVLLAQRPYAEEEDPGHC